LDTDTLEPYSTTWNASAAPAGSHTITATAYDPAGNTAVSSITVTVPRILQRIEGIDRYEVAVNAAREHYGDWSGITDIVIASGEDRAAADPLSASGLCGIYDAPLFLVRSTSVPASVKTAVKEIASKAASEGEGVVRIHIVGGTGSVPDARYSDLVSYVGFAGTLSKDRIIATGDRYDLAAAVAQRMKTDPRGWDGANPPVVLIANGADANTFFDPLALSPIAAAKHYPILLVTRTSIPAVTASTLASFGSPRVIIGGGPATVYDSVKATLGAERWYGPNRYSTAVAIATNAIAEGWLADEVVGVAAKLPDALTGGSMVGAQGGVMLVTRSDLLSTETGNFIAAHKATISSCYVFGGTASVWPTTFNQIAAKLQ
jgi:putative cell wall-binding protein